MSTQSFRSLLTLALATSSLAFIACQGSSESTATADEPKSSPHGTAPTPREAWGAEELATDAEEPATTAESANEDGAEETDAEDPKQNGVGTSEAALSTTSGTTFNFTYYWVAQRPPSDPNEVTLRDCDGKFMTYASRDWRDEVRMEMTGRFTASDGTRKVFNDWDGCWKIMSSYYNWGAGVSSPYTGKSYKLRPFRSIAVDKDVLKIGKWYYIKQLDGMQMPYPVSTMKHDGCVRAVDTGWSFAGRHVDFFVGLKSAYSKLVNGDSNIAGRETVTVYDGSVKCAEHIERGY